MQPEAKRAIEATPGTVVSAGKIGAELKCIPNPPFIEERLKLFDAIYAKNIEQYKSILSLLYS